MPRVGRSIRCVDRILLFSQRKGLNAFVSDLGRSFFVQFDGNIDKRNTQLTVLVAICDNALRLIDNGKMIIFPNDRQMKRRFIVMIFDFSIIMRRSRLYCQCIPRHTALFSFHSIVREEVIYGYNDERYQANNLKKVVVSKNKSINAITQYE